MNLYLQEWTNGTASLVNEYGHVLSVFASIEEAKSICRIWQVETVGTVKCQTNSDSPESTQVVDNTEFKSGDLSK